MDDPATYLRFNYTDERELFEIDADLTCGEDALITASETELNGANECGDFYHEPEPKHLTVLIDGKKNPATDP